MPALTPFLSATGPLEELQIACVCREALKVARPVRLLTRPIPRSSGQGAQLASVLGGGVPRPRGAVGPGRRGPSPVAGSSPFPSWLSHFLFEERGGGSCLGGGPKSSEGVQKRWDGTAQLLSGAPVYPQGLHHLHSQGKIHRDIKVGVRPWALGEAGRLSGAPDGIRSSLFLQGANLLLTLQGDVKLGQYLGNTLRVRVLWELLESQTVRSSAGCPWASHFTAQTSVSPSRKVEGSCLPPRS